MLELKHTERNKDEKDYLLSFSDTVKKINSIQIWYLESRVKYLELRTFLPIKYSCKMCLEIIF